MRYAALLVGVQVDSKQRASSLTIIGGSSDKNGPSGMGATKLTTRMGWKCAIVAQSAVSIPHYGAFMVPRPRVRFGKTRTS